MLTLCRWQGLLAYLVLGYAAAFMTEAPTPEESALEGARIGFVIYSVCSNLSFIDGIALYFKFEGVSANNCPFLQIFDFTTTFMASHPPSIKGMCVKAEAGSKYNPTPVKSFTSLAKQCCVSAVQRVDSEGRGAGHDLGDPHVHHHWLHALLPHIHLLVAAPVGSVASELLPG